MYEIPKSITESITILSKEHIILEKCGQILEKTIYLGVACKFTNCTKCFSTRNLFEKSRQWKMRIFFKWFTFDLMLEIHSKYYWPFTQNYFIYNDWMKRCFYCYEEISKMTEVFMKECRFKEWKVLGWLNSLNSLNVKNAKTHPVVILSYMIIIM